MGLNFGETTKMVVDSAKDFTAQHIQPHVMDWDEAQYFPASVMRKAGEMGFMGVLIPEVYGGAGMGYHEYIAIIEEISKVDPSIGLSVAAHNSLAAHHIYLFGNEEQRMRWLPKLASGQWIGAWGLTEYNTGSDAKGMNATARKEGDRWVLNGTKNFITHGKSCDLAVVIFRNGQKGDSHGMTSFVIERGTPGFSSGKVENKLGMRASETAEVIFDNCIVPDSHRLGAVGEGFIQSMKVLDGGRISIAALSLGIAKGAFEASVKYAKEREQFGKPLVDFQAVQIHLAEMKMKVEAARLLLYRAVVNAAQGLPSVGESSIAKCFANEAVREVTGKAMQLMGGYGYSAEYPIEQKLRDAWGWGIAGGAIDIQKVNITSALVGRRFNQRAK
ncbi:MAG: acyl-CoA dehydrogenase [Flavobacteriia bacterium]|nr:acyl-CoA dehydrogenase [Flavobacteriia bacterium]